MKRSFYDEIFRNKLLSALLFVFVLAFTVLIGWVFGYVYNPSLVNSFIIFAFIIAFINGFVSFFYSDRIVLRSVKAVPANPVKHRRVINLLEGLCIAAGLPVPRLYIINSSDINAFATGRNPDKAVIAVTRGAVEKLDRDELEGVLAHELSHVRNYDVMFMSLIAVLVGLIVIISELFRRSLFIPRRDRDRDNYLIILIGLILAIVSPFIVQLIQLAVSRKREFLADASAALLTRNPDGLADALEKIKLNKGLRVNGAVNHLFIANPSIKGLFSSHPPIDERIKRLRSM